MPFTIEFQIDHLTRALEATRITPQEMLGSIGESLLTVNRDRHEQGLAPDGTPWKPLAPSTLVRKRTPFILHENGDMLPSFNYQIVGDELVLRFSDRKAAWHHYGTHPYTITPKKAKALHFGGIYSKRVRHPGLPARELIGFPASDQKLVTDLIDDHLSAALNAVR